MARKSIKEKMNEIRPVMVMKKGTLKEKPVAALKGDVVPVEPGAAAAFIAGPGKDRAARQIVIFADSPEDKELIRSSAKNKGVSMSRFILTAVLPECD